MRVAGFFFALWALLLSHASAAANFHRDVVYGAEERVFEQEKENDMQSELLGKAIPIEEYNAQLRSLGVDVPSSIERELDGNDGDDDFYQYGQEMYSFSGYSMKYAKCQPVQRFSEEAIESGEYSPMITEDVVILRLCPYQSCYSNRQYGCHYNYAEYAISITDYIKIMLSYTKDNRERLCQWCANCGYGYGYRKLEDGDNGDQEDGEDNDDEGENDEQEDEEDENNNDGNNDDNNNNGNNNNYYYNDDGNNNNNNYYDNSNYNNNPCGTYASYCQNYGHTCANGEPTQYYYGDDSYESAQYVNVDEYIEYSQCSELADKWGDIYFTRPKCDTSDNSIKMAVYYDQYCTNYAGDDVDMDVFEVAFNDTAFANYYESSCIDCSESNYPPGFISNSYLCNAIRRSGAQCTANMVYNLFDSQSYDSTECSFIESIRFGTYDSNGEITLYPAQDSPEMVTDFQKIGLVGSAIICGLLVMYSCFLHHSMTNLLIKSLSHRELLPPSRHGKRRTPLAVSTSKRLPRTKGSSRSGRSRVGDEEDDWDHEMQT